MRDSDRIRGCCPMGCGETLFIGDGGHITCSYVECPDPGAVATILAERESEHIVTLHSHGFTIRHPLRERRATELEDCDLHRYLTALDGPPRQEGRYRVKRGKASWTDWEPVYPFHKPTGEPGGEGG